MKIIELFIRPFAKENEVKTKLIVNNRSKKEEITSKDNRLTSLVVNQPMRKWLTPYKKKLFVWEGFLPEIIEEFNDSSLSFVFHGCKADYAIFKKTICEQQEKINRNGETAHVEFAKFREDKWSPDGGMEILTESLDTMRSVAEDWSDDDLIDKIDELKAEIGGQSVRPVPDDTAIHEVTKALLEEYGSEDPSEIEKSCYLYAFPDAAEKVYGIWLSFADRSTNEKLADIPAKIEAVFEDKKG
ncbi:MAG: hypothetical protein LUE20_05180 [Oscillospiraceae bacterium]|nr:hypothetical protein [Oscillospiraceae bacterium]